MTTDYRALCAELLEALDGTPAGFMGDWPDLRAKARNALLQPPPIEPSSWCETDAEQRAWYAGWTDRDGVMRPKPIPVSERLPGPEDCDADGRCWFGTPSGYATGAIWTHRKAEQRRSWDTHWLPHWALQVPGVEDADA